MPIHGTPGPRPEPKPEPSDHDETCADCVQEASEESFPASDAPSHTVPHSTSPIDPVQEASEESFPASDPPSFTPTTHPGGPSR